MSERIYYSSEAEERANQQRTILALTMLALGLGLGGIFALLFAPSKGEEVCKAISEAASQAYEDSRESTAKTVDSLQKDIDKLRKDVEDRIQA